MEKVSYAGWKNCIRLSNREIELIATTDVGPRIIKFGFIKGENLFKEYQEQLGRTGDKEWCIYGGHRLWYAPEHEVKTYWPDNAPVEEKWDGKTLTLTQKVDDYGVQKGIEITVDPDENKVVILHRIMNKGSEEVELAPWCLTVMKENCRAIFPQEPYKPHPEYLLPARPLVLWHYTDMADPRYTWGKKYIQLRQDPGAKTKQKIGFLNKAGWAAVYLKGNLFIKKYDYISDAEYPDYGCNTETYTDSDMIELETLGPLAKIAPGGKVEHTERWSLHELEIGGDENSIDRKILPFL